MQGPVRLQFGIPFVGNCIKPEAERRSDDRLRRDLRCTDKLPVPCSDGLCKPTFVHCLRGSHVFLSFLPRLSCFLLLDVYEKSILGEAQNAEEVATVAPKRRKHNNQYQRLAEDA